MKKLFKRNSSKKIKANLDGSFANISVDGSPGRSISQLSNYSGDSNYSLSNISIDSLGPGKGYVLAKKQKLPATCKAAWKGDIKKLKKNLKKGDVNEQDKDNRTPLHYACAQGHNEIISHLLSTGSVNPNLQDTEGKTALIKCCECNQVTAAQLLIDSNRYAEPIDCNLMDNDGNTPLILAILNDNIDISSLLVISEVDVNCCNKQGESPIIVATKRNNLELVELLGAESADINSIDGEGRSPLMTAVKNNYVSIVKYILSLFPDTAIQDKHGWTAYDFAQTCADNTCLRLLEDHENRCDNPDFNPEHDNLTTINSQDEAINHKNSANDWTAPPDGELTEDENSYMSTPVEFCGTTSPDILMNKNGDDIEIDVDHVLTSKSVSEVDLSMSAADNGTNNTPIKPGHVVNKLLDALNQSDDMSEGQIEKQIMEKMPSSPSTPGTDDNSLGQISNIHDDDGSSLNLSSEDIGYIPTAPMPTTNSGNETKNEDLKLKLGFDIDDEESSTTYSAVPNNSKLGIDEHDESGKSGVSTKKELPSTPRNESSEGSTPKASPRTDNKYDIEDDASTLSSITEKTEPVVSPALGEVVSPDPISPLPDNTLSDSISINSDVEISGYLSESIRSAASGRKSISPKGDTPSDFRMTPASNDDHYSDHSTKSSDHGGSIASGVRSAKRTPPQTPPSNRSSIASGVRSKKVTPTNSFRSEPKLHYGSMLGNESDSDDTMDDIMNKSGPDKSKSEINDLSIVSNSKSSLMDRNILSPASSSPHKLKRDADNNGIGVGDNKKVRSEPYSDKSDDEFSETETDNDAELLLAKSGDLLSNYKGSSIIEESSMNVDVQDDDVRIPAAFAPDHGLAMDMNTSFESNLMNAKDNVKPSSSYAGADVTMEDSSSDESETGKLAKKYIQAKKSRESVSTSPSIRPSSSSNSNYCSSVSPMQMEGNLIEKSAPTSKHVTPRVSFGTAPILFADPDRASTPIKPDKIEGDPNNESEGSSSQHQTINPPSVTDPVLSAKFQDIERRKSEAERELEEIRKTRRSQSPCSMTESYATDSKNIHSDLQRVDSEESINSLIAGEEMLADVPINVESAIKMDLEANPDVPSSARAKANMSDCASVISEAVSYIQTNLDIQTNPVLAQLQDEVKESRRKLQKVSESKNKSETIRKQLEIETEELRRKIDVISKSKTTDEKSRMDMELELRSLQFKYDHEKEERSNLEGLYNSAKENMKLSEKNRKSIIEDQYSSDSAKKQLLMDLQKSEQSEKLMNSEIEDLKRLLEEEQKTRLIQEEMFNDQVNRSRDLSTETSKNIRQKQDLLQQLTQAEEVVRNAEVRNKSLSSDLANVKAKYETERKTWTETDLEFKSTIQKVECKNAELEVQVTTQDAKIKTKDAAIKDFEDKLRAEESELTLAKHGFELKENELSISNKQYSEEIQKLKLDFANSSTERDLAKKHLVDMEGRLKQAEEIGTASANEQINLMNQKIGEIEVKLKFKIEENDEVSHKLRNAEEDIRQLEMKIQKGIEIQTMKEESFSADTNHLQESASQKDEKIQDLQINIGELEEMLLHSENRVRDTQFQLDETNKNILEKSGSLLSNAEREQVKDKYVSSLEEHLSKERGKYTKSNHELEILKCKFDLLSEDKKSLEVQVEQVTECLQMRDDSVTQVNEKLFATRTKLLKENDKSREELKRKNEALQEHISELRQNLVSAEAAKDMGEIELSRLKQEVKQQASSLRVKEETFKQQKTNLDAKNTELCGEMKKIEAKLQELYTDRLHLKNELSNTKDKSDAEIDLRKNVERKLDGISLSHSTLNNEMIELKGNYDREAQNKGHYMELYKSEQDYSKQLKDEVSEMKKNIASLESLNETLKTTVDEFKDSNREEKLGRTLASKELDETRHMLENEIKTRSHIGSRITNLERENQDLNNTLHGEQKRVKKTLQSRKVAEANVDALQQNLTDLHKDIAELKDQLIYTQKVADEGKLKEQKYNALKGKVQRDKVAQRRRVDELEKTLEDAHNSVHLESEKRGQAEGNYLLLKNEVQGLSNKLQKLSAESSANMKARQNAEVRCQQLQMELNNVHNKIGSELVTRDELEIVKKQAEGKARIELNRKLEEINQQLEEQSKARCVVEAMRADNEEKMRRGFEKTAAELKKELNETKHSLTKDSVSSSTLVSENRMIKSLLEKEQDHRKMLEVSLEETQRELQDKRSSYAPRDSRDTPDNNNYNTARNKIYSDPSETLARMKARLNQSINKYLDEKINNDGSTELWLSPRTSEHSAPENLSPRTELARSGRGSPSPRYMAIMKSNYYL